MNSDRCHSRQCRRSAEPGLECSIVRRGSASVAGQFDARRDVLAVEGSACQCAIGRGLAIVAFEGGASISIGIGGCGGLFQLSFRERKGVFVGGGLYPGGDDGGDQGEGEKSEEVFGLHPGGVDLGSRPASDVGSGQSRSVGVGLGGWAGAGCDYTGGFWSEDARERALPNRSPQLCVRAVVVSLTKRAGTRTCQASALAVPAGASGASLIAAKPSTTPSP
ncbi:hypothetical protein KC342_g4 [Hortaea werneckii]|nr:hypothetical protein KC342_g4 [Hortaea werneckii]